jgi:hypothetical protein
MSAVFSSAFGSAVLYATTLLSKKIAIRRSFDREVYVLRYQTRTRLNCPGMPPRLPDFDEYLASAGSA